MSPAAPPAEARSTGETRPEILVLRGIAILAILVHHLWQGRLPGGFAALDVFFVISGYLVTRILFGMRERGGIDIWAYLARRARRILPSAITVLLACLVGMFAFVSITDWGRTAGELLASAVFMENWALIAADLAYAAPDSATALQHYWTLAVEAQFYVAWALLMMVLLGRGAAFGAHRRRAGAIGIAVVLAISLAVSVVWCALAPVSGYLSTATRIWELAAGGLLAVLVRRIPPLRVGAPLAIAGWALIAGSLVLLNTSMAWPGFLAVIPVAGAVLVIAAGVPHDAPRLRRLTDNRFTRDLADSSYAIYLWHWPILVFADRALGHPPGTPEKIGIVVASLALGWATTVLVERPIRFGPLARARPLATLTVAALAISAVVVPALAVRHVMQRTTELYTAVAQAPAADLCAGAEARMPGADCVDGPYPGLSPDPLGEWEEVSVLHAMGCATDNILPDVHPCDFGDPDGDVHVALVGDSHAMKLWAALKAIAESQGWRLTTFLKAQCEFTLPEVEGTSGCPEWRAEVAERLRDDGPWDLVVTTGAAHATGGEGAAEGYRAVWQPLIDAGARLIVVHDNPYLEGDVRACIADHLDDPSACDNPRSASFLPDTMADAARDLPGAHVVDLTELFCDATTCFAVVGGVITHRDFTHITDEFSRSYAPYLAAKLAAIAPELFSG
ncbi:MAG: acyltransferase [Microbacteriaceae bacterium]|nr:acyltransferase [Microbacteriaceae bacterium]